MGLRGGQVVNMLALYSDDLSSNVVTFSVKFVVEKNQKRVRGWYI